MAPSNHYKSAWPIQLIRVLSWIILLFSLIGSSVTVYYMGLFSLGESGVILDPIGIILFLLFLAPGLICFPLFQALIVIHRDVQSTRTNETSEKTSPSLTS